MEILPLIFVLLAVAFVRSEPYGECPAGGRPTRGGPPTVTLLADTEDCTKYWVCFMGHAKPARCHKGQEFNLDTNKCDTPENANCVRPLPQPTDAPEEPEVPEVPEVPTNQCRFLPEHQESFFSHETDCGRFYQCTTEGDLILHECPKGLHFNAETVKCEKPESAGCQ